ncbi:dephospho-CoA kinase [Jonquetella anthropi]|uniref:dephospho-CoA kinase n=1 Tax=Jonquetella anthropi TaxID=428712 RepID=UPI0001B915A5|nr:dephospho-CoA kinase [Jonquetella anthropi]EEX49305.1 dephospho-CoA kinase [Jonquetella anthropi E3_33 E1]
MLAIGLTGQVGAGKSTALAWFGGRGAATLSADRIADRVWEREEILERARRLWGSNVVSNGRLDRAALARRAFASPDEQAKLCGLIHPPVRAEIERSLPANGIAVVEIPLLFESGLPWWCQGVIYVAAPLTRRGERNAGRGLDEAELSRREAFFSPDGDRKSKSDWVVVNDGSLEELHGKLECLWDELRLLDGLMAVGWQGSECEAKELEAAGQIARWSCSGGECRAFSLDRHIGRLSGKLAELWSSKNFCMSCRARKALVFELSARTGQERE